MEDWQNIDFRDDRDGGLFTITVQRTNGKGSGKAVTSPKNNTFSRERSGKILELLANNPKMTIPQMALELGISTRAVEKQIANLRKNNQLKRIGPAKGGHWQVQKEI